MENRRYTRQNLEVMAEIQLEDGTCLYGETSDLGLGGAYVNLIPPQAIKVGESCRLRLILRAQEQWVNREFATTVIHIQDTGLGLQFDQASLTLQHVDHDAFLQLLMEHAEDRLVLRAELQFCRETARQVGRQTGR